MSLLTCRKIAVLKFTVFVLHEEKPKGVGAHFTSSEKSSSVPGRMQTAVVESSGAANPRVPVLKLRVVSLSPTFAGRDLTWCRLKSHMTEELLFCERPTNPTPVAKDGLISQHAWLAKEGPTSRRRGSNPPIAPGKYQVVTDEESIDGLSFPVFRRTHSRA